MVRFSSCKLRSFLVAAVFDKGPFLMGGLLLGARPRVVGLFPLICCTLRMLLLGVLNKEVEDEALRRVFEIPLCEISANDKDGTRRRESTIFGTLASSDMTLCLARRGAQTERGIFKSLWKKE